MPVADPAWDALLGKHGMGRVGGYRVVRGEIRPGISEEDMKKIADWADQVHTRTRAGETELVAVRRDGPPHREKLVMHLLLFAAALASAVVAGGFLSGTDVFDTRFAQVGGVWLPVPTGFAVGEMVVGLTFGLTFVGILLGHEMGHYLTARRHGVSVSLPWFIPFPPYFSLVGTLGAFIRLRGPMMQRSVLFDIGIAGPLPASRCSCPPLSSATACRGDVDDRGGLYPSSIHSPASRSGSAAVSWCSSPPPPPSPATRAGRRSSSIPWPLRDGWASSSPLSTCCRSDNWTGDTSSTRLPETGSAPSPSPSSRSSCRLACCGGAGGCGGESRWP